VLWSSSKAISTSEALKNKDTLLPTEGSDLRGEFRTLRSSEERLSPSETFLLRFSTSADISADERLAAETFLVLNSSIVSSQLKQNNNIK